MADRYRRSRQLGIADRAVALPYDPETTDDRAKRAEIWFADRFGLPHPEEDGPRDWDFRFTTSEYPPRLVTIDVKWSDYPRGHLIHRQQSRTRCSHYILVIGEADAWGSSAFRLAGWAYGYELHGSIRDLGHGPVYALSQSELHPDVDRLMAALGRPAIGSSEPF
jgi:hypothetical protein